MRSALVALALLIPLLIPLACLAQMYKCTDERGVARYSDSPGAGCKQVEIRGSPPLGGAGPRAAPDLTQQEADFQRRRIQREQNEEKAARQRVALERRCAAMQTEMQRLASARRLVTVDADGERTEIDDAARNASIASLKGEIARQCP